MKKLLIPILLTLSITIFGQTIEDQTFEKSCDCLKKTAEQKHELERADINNCIKISMDDVLKNTDEKTVKKFTKNIRFYMETIQMIQNRLIKNCLTKKED